MDSDGWPKMLAEAESPQKAEDLLAKAESIAQKPLPAQHGALKSLAEKGKPKRGQPACEKMHSKSFGLMRIGFYSNPLRSYIQYLDEDGGNKWKLIVNVQGIDR